jgi:murein L,D-transpeptidase YcbB/YkuD
MVTEAAASPPDRVRRMRAMRLIGALGLAIAAGCSAAADGVAESLRARVAELRSERAVRIDGAEIAARGLIAAFYERRGFRLAWSRPGQAAALARAVEASRSHGLDPEDYHAAVLRRAAGRATTAAAEADLELLQTDAVVRLAYHLHFGKANPRELYPGWNFTRSLGPIDPVPALEAIAAASSPGDAIERYAPALPLYRQLREALARYRAIAGAGGWPPLERGDKLELGASGPRVAALRTRLAATGDLGPDGGASADFDAALDAAVRRFQDRHGLDADGVVGRRTLAALNVDVARRIDQLRVNLERVRWVAQDLAGDYLVVDIAGFSARLVLDGRPAWSSRVVVGRPYRRTPVFRATLDHLVLNPTWSVPPTILREDVLPKVVQDPAYLERHHMQVLDAAGRPVDAAGIAWERYRSGGFPYHIVEAPGAENPLGRVKFMLPNPHAVYLHDTPAGQLFERTERAFSSGCIRLERAFDLAVLLLDDPERWSAEALRAAIASGETRTVRAKRRVPVMLLYFTAEADEDGTVRFRPDLYNRDPRVLAALGAPFRFSPVDGARRSR